MLQLPKMDLFLTENRGWGVRAAAPVPRGTFIVEYAGGPSALIFLTQFTGGQDGDSFPGLAMRLRLV